MRNRPLFGLLNPCVLWVLAVFLLVGCSGTNVTSPDVDGPVAMVASALPSALRGAMYGANLQASDGVQPYSFAVMSGSLPAGLTLSAAGRIAGMPTAAGTASFVVQVTDAAGTPSKATQSFSITTVPPLAVASAALPVGQVGTAYAMGAPMTGGVAPVVVALASGALPAGLTIGTNGMLAGTPTVAGDFSFLLTAHDSFIPQESLTTVFTMHVDPPPPLQFAYAASGSAALGTAFTQAAKLTGGIPPYTVALGKTVTLPAGIKLGADGSLSGTPTVAGSFALSMTASDSSPTPQTVTATTTLHVYNAMVAVDTTHALAVVPQTGFGMHTSVYDGSLNDVAALPALLADAGVTMLRYPGGSYADNYHWAQYTLTPTFASGNPACDVTASGYLAPGADFASFVKTLAATKTQAIITVNYGSSLGDTAGTRWLGTQGAGTCSEPRMGGQPQEAAAWVAYANGDPASTQVIGLDAVGFDWKTVGFWAALRAAPPISVDDGYNFLRAGMAAPIGIKYWEIGNEIYYNGYNSNLNTESDVHAPYVYPSGYGGTYSSRAGVEELSATAYGTNAAAFLQAMKAADPTIKLGLVLSSTGVDPIPASWNPAALQAVCGSASFDFGILHYYPGTYNAVTAAQLLASPQADMPALVARVRAQLAANCPASAGAVQLFVTETNSNGPLVAGTPAVVTGLYAAHEFLTGLEAGLANVDWLELHDTAGSFLAGTTETAGPAFYGIQMARLLAGVGDTLVTASSTNVSVLAHAAYQASGKKSVLLINSSAATSATVQVTVAGSALGATAAQYSFGIGTTQSGAVLASTAVPIAGTTFVVTVPAYTAVELVIP